MKNFAKLFRIYGYFVFFAIGLFIVITKLFFLQILNIDFKGKNVSDKRQYEMVIKPKRGSIFTNDNLEIALDLEYQTFIIDPTLLKNENEVEKIVEILVKVIPELKTDEIKTKIYEKIRKNNKYYPFDDIIITNDQKKQIEELIRVEKVKDKKFFKSHFIFFNKLFKRKYVDNSIFENVVGYLNNEDKGVYGLENRYEEILRGKEGLITGTRPFTSSLAEYTLPYLIDKKIIKKEEIGNSLVLNINSIMQYSLDEVLEGVYNSFTPVSAMGIVMEADTGKIVAMDSYPKAKDKTEIKNLNMTALFEPGSIFKPITVSAAMNEGIINENTLIHSDGFIKVKNRTIRDHDDTTKGTMTVSKIMAHSGNVGLVKISQMMDTSVFYNYLSKFGLGEKTGIDTSFETSSRLMKEKDFTEVRRSNVSFGQGINMTQLQILVALTATINGGKILEPQLVDKIVDGNGKVVKTFEPVIKSTVISETTSAKIRNMLEEVVSSGTGQGIQIDGYRIGGKTGTAQKAGARGYEYGKYFSSFFTFFPADNPKYTIIITVDEPHGLYYGAAVALPAAKEMLDKIIKYKNILPDKSIMKNPPEKLSEDVQISDNLVNRNNKIEDINLALNINLMPNLVGLTKKNLIKLNLKGYNVKIIGNGKVVKQSPEVGTTISKNTPIILNLE